MREQKHRADLSAANPATGGEVREILAARARLLARAPKKDKAAEETLEVQAFSLGGEYLGVPTAMVREIQALRRHHWVRLPGAPSFIAGIVNLRGRIYSLMDLGAFWGLPPRPITDRSHLLLVGGVNGRDDKEIELTLLIDDCSVVRLVRTGELQPPPAVVSAQVQGYLRGVTPDMMLVIDLEALLADPAVIVADED